MKELGLHLPGYQPISMRSETENCTARPRSKRITLLKLNESMSTTHAPPTVSLPVSLIADVQDALMMAMTDLKRLEGLLDHATDNLMDRFGTANRALGELPNTQHEAIATMRESLHQAVTELQFHDMSTQLIVHTGKVLEGCAWKLAEETMEPEEGEIPLAYEPIPERPSPVTQSEMDAGAIELF